MSSYQEIRQRNLMEKAEFLKQLNIVAYATDLANEININNNSHQQTPKARKRKLEKQHSGDPDYDPKREDDQGDDDDIASLRLARKIQRLEHALPRMKTRSRSIDNPFQEALELNDNKSLVIKFPFFKKIFGDDSVKKEVDGDDDYDLVLYDSEPENDIDEGTICPPLPERSRSTQFVCRERVVLAPEEISEKHLAAVCKNFGAKQYSQAHGTTCHQCRQKTVDMKTICRDPDCRGLRGAFCGRCLEIRYGEIIEEVLKDPNWRCPACRGICNCSICRRRAGLNCTGVMIHAAQEEGFDSVKDYLAHKTKSRKQTA